MDLSVLQGPGGGKAKGREGTEVPDKSEEFNNKGPQYLMSLGSKNGSQHNHGRTEIE